jgi:hypothetical protein
LIQEENKFQKYRKNYYLFEIPRETGNTAHTRRGKKKKKHNTICIGHHHMQTRHAYILPQTTGGKDEPNIVSMREEYQSKLICKRKLDRLSLLLLLSPL